MTALLLDELTVTVPVDAIKERYNPFEWEVWDIEYPISITEVDRAIASKHLESLPFSKWTFGDDRNQHASRIAYLVVNGWDDPIDIEVDEYGGVLVLDGNHRLAAAIYRGDPHIAAILGGFIDEIEWYEVA